MDLTEQLRLAVEQEDYESAAILRDVIDSIANGPRVDWNHDMVEVNGPPFAWTNPKKSDIELINSYRPPLGFIDQVVSSVLGSAGTRGGEYDSVRLRNLIELHYHAVRKELVRRSAGINPRHIFKVVDPREMTLTYMALDQVILKVTYHSQGISFE